MTGVEIVARPPLTEAQLTALFAAAWPDHQPRAFGLVLARSLAYCGAFRAGELVGFVNVAWDGGDHAFLIDTKVRLDHQRRGIATELVRIAARHAKAAGCEWLHVDFDEPLGAFYYDACGFTPAPAGVMHLPDLES